MSRPATVFAIVFAAFIAAVAIASGPDAGPESDDATVAWVAANDPAFAAQIADLDAQLRAVRTCGAYRSHLTGQVVAGELSFTDAAAEFLRLNRDGVWLRTLRSRFPGRSDEELAYWNVIEYVRHQGIPAEKQARALARLEGEFEARFGRPPCGPF